MSQLPDPPRTPEGRRVYAVGDIHGRLDLLENLIAQIAADAETGADKANDKANVLVFLGDYVDRGAHSKAVIELLSGLRLPGFEVICLKGNHEDMMLDFIYSDSEPRTWQKADGRFNTWLTNGGTETLESYGTNVEGPRLRAALPKSHLDFLNALQFKHIEGDYAFVHAGVRPGVTLEEQDDKDMMWIRAKFLESRADHGKVIVHGHSITDVPDVQQNRIGIDTGAYRSGVLTALVLENDRRRFLST